MESVPGLSPVSGRPRFAVTALIGVCAAALVGCGGGTTGEVAVPATNPSATAVNLSLLDPGRYPTKPQPPLGNAGSEQAGRLVEGRRMASYVVGPWQVDPDLNAPTSGDVDVIDDYHQLGTKAMWPPIEAGAFGLPFIVGFLSQRHAPGPGQQKSLRNIVLRFAAPGSASAAAQGFFDHAMAMPRAPDVTPIVTEPEQAISIPGHPDTKAALLTFQEGAQTVKELTVSTSHGPYVLMQVVRCAAGPDCQAQLASRTLDLQLPLIDTFTPTDPARFATLPLDPTGLLARTLPLPDDETTSTTGATYAPPGALHFEDDPVKIGPALKAASVDAVAINRTTVYQAQTPDNAQKLVKDYSDAIATAAGAKTAQGVPGLPQSHCTLIPGGGGLVPHHWCVAAAVRYMIKTVARQLDTAHQQAAAQYRILAG
jgi:hypothetical protein